MKPQIILLTIIGLFFTGSFLNATENLITNPSFEEEESDENPKAWIRKGWKWEPSVTQWRVDRNIARTGKNSICVNNILENHAYFVQTVKVKENSRYLISGWVKTENVGADAEGAGISIINKFELAGDFRGTNPNWQEADLYVTTGKGVKRIEIMLGIGNYGSENTGKAWFDDITMTEVSAIPVDAIVTIMESGQEIQPGDAGKAEKDKTKEEKKADKQDEGAMFLYIVILIVVVVAGFVYFVIMRRLEKKAKIKKLEAEMKEKEEDDEESDNVSKDE